jgi:hypothetical protein
MESNATPFDAWTLVHIASGVVLGAAGVPLPQTVAALIAYEVLEWSIEHPSGSPIFGSKRPESQVNVAADIGVALLGYAFTREYLGMRERTEWEG